MLRDDDNWSTNWNVPTQSEEEQKLVIEVKDNYTLGMDWEAEARVRFEYDYKFAHGDAHNYYQWDSDLVKDRELLDRPVLTVNKTRQHNLMIINDAKQNKAGVRVRPVSDQASFEAAEIYQELVYHTDYISNAETVYDHAIGFQVDAGIGYWKIVTDWEDNNSFNQEIYIRKIADPRNVILDPNINEVDGSDARWGIVFEDIPKELFKVQYPKYSSLVNSQNAIGNQKNDTWTTRDTIKVADYYRKSEKEDKLVTWVGSDGGQVLSLVSKLGDTEKLIYKELKKLSKQDRTAYQFRERNVVTDDIEIIKIAGDRIIERSPWPGKYVPIVRVVGTETIIDGVLDRKGHTRALINAQQIYNYNTSANVEYGALQTKSPWVAPSKAIENFEEYYKTANSVNHSYLPYNHMDEDGNPIPPPVRPPAPQASPAYVQQMQIAQNEMMMASGQYQSQFGENENAKSGVAINARQRQGDRSTYHFIDNQATAFRFTGKILIDLYPKVYDTKRLKQILTRNGRKMNIHIDPDADQAFQKGPTLNPDQDRNKQIDQVIFNPSIGTYDIRADTGPNYATRRMEAFNALSQLAAQNPQFMNVGGDLYFQVSDFPEADVLAERWRRIIPPNILGDSPNPQTEQLMHQASDKIQQLTAVIGDQVKKLADKNRELNIKEEEIKLRQKEAVAIQNRLDYAEETKRLSALVEKVPPEQLQPVVHQLIVGMLNAKEPGAGEAFRDLLKIVPMPTENEQGANSTPPEPALEQPPVPGARKAPDGNFYVPHPSGKGYLKVEK